MSIQDTPHPTVITSALLDWIAAGRTQPALAAAPRPLRGLDLRGHAPADAGRQRDALLRTLAGPLSVRAALAEAPLDDVLKAWEGLGYYARARNLHAAAQEIVALHGGEFPRTGKRCSACPASAATPRARSSAWLLARPEPVLDGNVRRVLCRVDDIADEPKAPARSGGCGSGRMRSSKLPPPGGPAT